MAEPIADTASSASPRRAWFWPAFILAILGGQVAWVLAMVYVATRDPSFAVEPDYYRQATHWDEAAAQARSNARLQWSATLSVGNDLGPLRERWLTCQLLDAQGRPIEDAQVKLTAFSHARADDRAVLELAPTSGGFYSAKWQFRKTGVWEFRITAHRGQDTFTYREQREIYPPGEGRPWPH